MSSHQMWYKLRNELKYRELPVPSTFMTVGELRGLIHEQLALPDGETVLLYPDEDLSYETRYPDVKQFPRGSRFRATRTTVEQLAKEDEQRAGQAEGSKKEDESQKPDAGEDSNADSEESEFGPDPWDREAADKWKEKEKRAVKPKREAANDQVTNMAEVITPAPSKPAAATAIPDSQELPALTYPHQSRELTQHEWEEKLRPRRNAHAGNKAADDTAAEDGVGASVEQTLPASTALVPAETRAVPVAVSRPSLLQQHPEIQYRCQSFLPQAPIEMLYEVFGVGYTMKRDEWDKWRADNADRNPPLKPSTEHKASGQRSRDQRSPSRSQRRSRSPFRHTSYDHHRSHTRSHGDSPSPHAPSRRHAQRSDRSPFEVDRWRESGRSPALRQHEMRNYAPSSRGASRMQEFSTHSSRSRSPASPGASRRRQQSSADVARRSGSNSRRRATPSPSPAAPTPAPRRRNFDTQLPPKAPRRKEATTAARHTVREPSYTPPPARGASSGPRHESGDAVVRSQPRNGENRRRRSRTPSQSPKRKVSRKEPEPDRRGRSSRGRQRSSSRSTSRSSSSSSSSSSGSSVSGSSSSQATSGRSRSPSKTSRYDSRDGDGRGGRGHRSQEKRKEGGHGGWRGKTNPTDDLVRDGHGRASNFDERKSGSRQDYKRCALQSCMIVQ